MASITNHGAVAQQIGAQNVSGSVHNTFFLGPGSGQVAGTEGLTDLEQAILASLAFPEMLERRGRVEDAHPGTCQWIVDLPQFKDWLVQNHGLLWIKGNPGTGKSTMMSHLFTLVCENATVRGPVLLEFFFSGRGSEFQRTPLGMFRSLINQLFRQCRQIHPVVQAAYQDKIEVFGKGRNAWQWQRLELEKMFSKAVLSALQHRSIVLFIDALDEAGARAARETATYFHQLNDKAIQNSCQLKICIACRHYPIVASNLGIEIKMEQNNQQDVSHFVWDRLSAQLDGYSGEQSQDGQELISEVVTKASGNFQWVSLIVPMVETFLEDGMPVGFIQDRLAEVPTELNDFYEHILVNVIDKAYRARSLVLFQWTCLAERPLSVAEMRYAMGAHNAYSVSGNGRSQQSVHIADNTPRMGTQIKSLSGGLLEYTEIPEPQYPYDYEKRNDKNIEQWQYVQVIHQSVKDFMLVNGLCILSRLATSKLVPVLELQATESFNFADQCQLLLHLVCLDFLAKEYSKLSDDNTSTRPQSSALLATSGLRRPSVWRSFGQYAILNLFVHAQKMGRALPADFGRYLREIERIMPQWSTDLRYLTFKQWGLAFGNTSVLHAAIAFQVTTLAKHLITSGLDTKYQDEERRTGIHLNPFVGNAKVGSSACDQHSLLETQDADGATPLVLAIKTGQLDFCRWLLMVGANPHVSTEKTGTALDCAVRDGQIEMVQLLLDAGVDVNKYVLKFGTSLVTASYHGRTEIAQLLIRTGATLTSHPVDSVEACDFSYPLHAAIYSGHAETAELLLEAGADINALSSKEGTVLHIACMKRDMKMVLLLLKQGAMIDPQNSEGETPLHAAVGSEYDDSNSYKSYPSAYAQGLHGTFYNTDLHGIMKVLIDAGADVNNVNKHGKTISDTARRHQDTLDILQRAGANPDTATKPQT